VKSGSLLTFGRLRTAFVTPWTIAPLEGSDVLEENKFGSTLLFLITYSKLFGNSLSVDNPRVATGVWVEQSQPFHLLSVVYAFALASSAVK